MEELMVVLNVTSYDASIQFAKARNMVALRSYLYARYIHLNTKLARAIVSTVDSKLIPNPKIRCE